MKFTKAVFRNAKNGKFSNKLQKTSFRKCREMFRISTIVTAGLKLKGDGFANAVFEMPRRQVFK
jgi:hypothetical protein